MNYAKDLKKLIKGKIILNEPLSRHTTFKIGGPASFWIEPKDIEDLREILRFIKRKKIPFFVIGHGSNLLINDNGFKGIVIRLNSDFFKKIKVSDNYITVGSGVSLKKFIVSAREKSLGGCEFLAGIPGTVGGALVTNAGARRNSIFNNCYRNMSDLVKELEVMDFSGKLRRLERQDIDFGYRYSDLEKYIVISVKLKLNRKNKSKIDCEINDFLKYKRSTQDLSSPSAGCIFRNPIVFSSGGADLEVLSAGYLIDAIGLKNYRVGGAVISDKHANYVVNDKKASAKDVMKIIRFVQKKIKEKFNISLEPEIKII